MSTRTITFEFANGLILAVPSLQFEAGCPAGQLGWTIHLTAPREWAHHLEVNARAGKFTVTEEQGAVLFAYVRTKLFRIEDDHAGIAPASKFAFYAEDRRVLFLP